MLSKTFAIIATALLAVAVFTSPLRATEYAQAGEWIGQAQLCVNTPDNCQVATARETFRTQQECAAEMIRRLTIIDQQLAAQGVPYRLAYRCVRLNVA